MRLAISVPRAERRQSPGTKGVELRRPPDQQPAGRCTTDVCLTFVPMSDAAI